MRRFTPTLYPCALEVRICRSADVVPYDPGSDATDDDWTEDYSDVPAADGGPDIDPDYPAADPGDPDYDAGALPPVPVGPAGPA